MRLIEMKGAPLSEPRSSGPVPGAGHKRRRSVAFWKGFAA